MCCACLCFWWIYTGLCFACLVVLFGGFTQVCIDTAKKIMSLNFMSQQNYDTAKLMCHVPYLNFMSLSLFVYVKFILCVDDRWQRKLFCCYKSDFYVLFWHILKKLDTTSGTNYLFIIYPSSLYATYNIFLFDKVFS